MYTVLDHTSASKVILLKLDTFLKTIENIFEKLVAFGKGSIRNLNVSFSWWFRKKLKNLYMGNPKWKTWEYVGKINKG